MHPSEINISQNEYKAYQLVDFINSKKLKLTEKKKWNDSNMSMSIESILLGLTMTPIYIDASNPESWFVLDGRKRLQSLYAFFKGDFRLINLDFFPDYNGYKFEKLPFSLQAKLEEAIFTVYSINQGVSERVRLNLVLRIVPDLRNALSWEFKESLIDKSIKGELNFWIKLSEYNFAKRLFKPQSTFQLVLEYLKLKYIQHNKLYFNLHTNIEHIIFELNENHNLIFVEWELGLIRFSNIFDKHSEVVNNLYLNKRTVPIFIFYFGSLINNSDFLMIENNIEQFIKNWTYFYINKGIKLLKRSDAGIIYSELNKLIYNDSQY